MSNNSSKMIDSNYFSEELMHLLDGILIKNFRIHETNSNLQLIGLDIARLVFAKEILTIEGGYDARKI